MMLVLTACILVRHKLRYQVHVKKSQKLSLTTVNNQDLRPKGDYNNYQSDSEQRGAI